ncbi:uncharacterized protein EKO05_0004086 [Ascochyta rabiei]|uniref:uncharacterized protein n=1 Tax=Didymella rabiei TaxID=5454 RepID=UPI0021FB2C57|nr:uncharacterized protein EKO05_0004086 [Ascochyta rabiei]UPX13584.1 hypothetical protein EKO05_0004086 [Ascochyta rabiei]
MATAGAVALLFGELQILQTFNHDLTGSTAQTLTGSSTVTPSPLISQATPQWPSASGTPATTNPLLAPKTNTLTVSNIQAGHAGSTLQNCHHKTRWERFGHGLCTSCNE